MAEYFISDTHFNHENIIKYCNRPFVDVKEMNETLIKNWNANIKEEDTVYVLGDFICGPADTIPAILPRLNGHIVLVRGNHDTTTKLNIYKELYKDKVEVKDILYLKHGGLWFVCCHFPITDEAFFKMVTEDNSEVVMVHGHVHEKAPFADEERNIFNVSADATNFMPVPIDWIYSIIKAKYIRTGVWRDHTEN